MTATPGGTLLIDGNQLHYERWKHALARIVALWNEAEQQTPYRTTAEIEEATR